MSNILIVGAGKGLGKQLIGWAKGFDTIYALSRTGAEEQPKLVNINGDVTSTIAFDRYIKSQSLSLVIYLPSMWGETGNIGLDDYDNYMNVGPRGFLNIFSALNSKNLCEKNCLVVSIGSTGSEIALDAFANTNSKLYCISKLTQKALAVQLSRTHQNFRFANITLGSIEDQGKVRGVGYRNIIEAISYIFSQDSGVQFTDIHLFSNQDVI